jgi:hypothetical protein
MKNKKMRVAGIGILASMTGLVTAASMVLTAPADAARKHATHAAVEAPAPAPNESGSCVADASSVCSGFGQATNGSVSSGDSIADNGSVSSGCSVALDKSTASGGTCPPNAATTKKSTAAPSASPAKAVSSNPTFAG